MSAIWNLWWNHLGLRKLGLDLLSHAACTVVQQPLLWASAVLCLALPQQTFHYFSFSIYGVSSATQAFVSVWLVCCWCCFQTRILCPDYFGTHFVGQAVLELTEALPFSFWVLLGLKAFIIIPGLGITFVTSHSRLSELVGTLVLNYQDQQQLGKEKLLFCLHFTLTVLQGRKLEAGAEAGVVERCCLLVCSSWLSQPAFFLIKCHLRVVPPTVG